MGQSSDYRHDLVGVVCDFDEALEEESASEETSVEDLVDDLVEEEKVVLLPQLHLQMRRQA